MPNYSVADAKAQLPRLIDRARAGEEVIVTRHGVPVAEIRPTAAVTPRVGSARDAYARLIAGRLSLKDAPSSVDLLNAMYEQPHG